ncbi:Molybdenum cofactor sulfurtransferase [Purpureocillium takamizusanense]|uniref:Molybdenum cofactor sulfurase n=1 Tax=Purpureocillium takamizusanense TaxID=2060973 RepID=A0A9Q8QJR9_9HYPO|nr:Molybdenum cofactor sulfurtransferase [Purpureocillium takamizusanense]UNI20980.1 Molybdenum cofactor sulfurtransferase [Purpureocillium takamizusanense]
MAGHPTSAYNAAVDEFRHREFPMLRGESFPIPPLPKAPSKRCVTVLNKQADSVYLDHAGSTVCAKSLMDSFAAELSSVLYGNPHSASWPSQLSTTRIEDIRLRLLGFFKADPAEYDLVFVANATAGVKLVVEAMRSLPHGYVYAHHQACHTSLVGAREDALHAACLDDDGVQSWIQGQDPFHDVAAESTALFSFSAQSHMNGRRYPLSWAKRLKDQAATGSRQLYTLLDAASLSATSQLDLGAPELAADFIVLSLYKIFGFPDVGALIVRRSAEAVFDHRRYFGGGTVDMVVCVKEQWHARKAQFLHERLEDGTLPFHNIMAVDAAMTVHKKLFGSMDRVSAHTRFLASKLYKGLRSLQHGNGVPVCALYTDCPDALESPPTGPIVSFNLVNSDGGWVSLAEFDKLAILKGMHVRTGGLCSPGSIATSLGLEPWEMRRNLSAGFRCGTDNDIMAGKPTGVIRASLGAMSTISDVEKFLGFMTEFFVEQSAPIPATVSPQRPAKHAAPLRVKAITVYPIKSCAGFNVAVGTRWEVRPEGLAWDREWCLVHRGSGQALNQKRYPKMALLRPYLDFHRGLLRVEHQEPGQKEAYRFVEIPLSAKPDLFDKRSHQTSSRVCGEEISAQSYSSSEINDFFADALGVPCVLARFPAGGRGLSSRTTKARMQKYQRPCKTRQPLPGAFPDIPSPPDSDSEQQQLGRILLANESPMLLVHSSSVVALNQEIERRGGEAVSDATFRPNVVIESLPDQPGEPAYSEDSWDGVRIGDQDFKFLGACRRCHMVCVDQVTAERRQEPFSTLAKTRRFDGKVYFGSHMRHEKAKGHGVASQLPMIMVGDSVSVYDEGFP